ncbi:hypothetical protein QJN80_25600, partial [Escherichia coli]|nr:hypothetical protein [Escherichia coli]
NPTASQNRSPAPVFVVMYRGYLLLECEVINMLIRWSEGCL